MVEVVGSIQFTFFLRKPATSAAFKLWSAITDAEPTGYNTIGPGHTQAQGKLDAIDVIVSVQAVRVDIIFQGQSTPQGVPTGLEDAGQVLRSGLEASSKAMLHLDVGRTAVVMQGHDLASSIEDATLKIKEMLPGLPLPAGSNEVTYQLSVPRASGVAPHRQIRQVCRWQSARLQLIEISIGPTPQQTVRENFVAHLYVDVFSDSMEELNHDGAFASLKENAEFADTILRGGYNALG